MRRTVTLEIDSKAFSAAYRTLTGDQAKEMLVMLVCGGHSVSSHSACLSEIGIRPAPPPGAPGEDDAQVDGRIARAAEEFLKEVDHTKPSDVLCGLADRPRPGNKAGAREAFVRLLGAIHCLRKGVEYSKPLRLVASADGGDAAQAMSAAS